MKLRSLALQGFKSFADRTELRFNDGITAVVGPNGCGKSNISDAIRWVLGEQRASAIRGSRMDEAIFQGTASRRAVNRAEVSLVFSNEAGRLALPYDQIEIRRTIFREGGSEYQLNRTPCRLRDIHDLCRDTGLGATAYAVIEQGMVDSMLSDRTEDRRHLFEEAAGIGRYKDRRRSAQRRLEAAETDLSRLEDLITEIDSKVRSLARQRKRAQKYLELRNRRLSLEVTLAGGEIESLREELGAIVARHAELARDEPVTRADLSTAEADLEARRLGITEATRVRIGIAARLDAIGRRVAERDRELAVAEERGAHAERRLTQIVVERDDLAARSAALAAGEAATREERRMEQGRLETLTEHLTMVHTRLVTLRQATGELRRLEEAARRRENELVLRSAEADAMALRAEARIREADGRREHLLQEREEFGRALVLLDDQGDLFSEQARSLAARRAAREAERDACADRLSELRAQEAVARRTLVEAEDLESRLQGQLTTLETLIREHHGYHPAVAGVLASRDRFLGLVGPLTDFLGLDPTRAARVESALGSVLQILVVRDAATARSIDLWVHEASPADGVLAMVPEHLLPSIRELLEGVLFAGAEPDAPALLGRTERLDALRAHFSTAEVDRLQRAADRLTMAERITVHEQELQERESMLQSLNLELRRIEADEVGRTGQEARLQRSLTELDQLHRVLSAEIEQATVDGSTARSDRIEIDRELDALRTTWQSRAGEVAERETELEAVREEEGELRVAHARTEARCAELDRRIASAGAALAHDLGRAQQIEREAIEHRETMDRLASLRSQAGGQLQELFLERDAESRQLARLDAGLALEGETCQALEARIRSLRRAVEASADERHQLELRRTEHEAAERGTRDRLEAEWGRAFDRLVAEAEPVDAPPDLLFAELQAVAVDIERLGPVNMLAVEEHEEENQRLEFLSSQRDDLVKARDDLQAAIRQINRQAREIFLQIFDQIRTNFRRTFDTLFDGGSSDVWLLDPDDPLESPIEVSACPRGKKTQRIHLLSGGERALTALALLFAIYLVKPSPFCVLDEVDAPLDEANVGRFVSMLQQFKADTQFVVITHNVRTMEAADSIYGVTMEEAGVSTIVGVRLEDVLTPAGVMA